MGVGYNPRIITDGLILCIDAGNSKSYSGSGTTWRDLSGRNNNFAINNGAAFSSSNGGYFTFDGLDDDATLSSWSWPSTTSLCFCVYPISPATQYSRVVSTGNGDGFEIGLSSTNQLSYYTPTNAWNTSIFALDSAKWNFLAFSQTGTTVTVYKNGIASFTGNFTTTAGSNLCIGRRYNASEATNVRVANFQVYNRTLTQAEVLQNFNAIRGRYGI